MQSPQALLMQMMIGYWMSQPIYVAAKLGVADKLVDGPRSIDELASELDCHGPSLYRILRATASIGIFAERDDGRFELTSMGQLLRDDVPGSLRGWALWSGDEWHWRAWGKLLEGVKTGKKAFKLEHGVDVWSFLDGEADASYTFNTAMTGNAFQQQGGIVPVYEWDQVGTLVDIGGGEGHLLATILEAHPNVQGVLFDQPSVALLAERQLTERGLGSRMRAEGGDFFESVPTGGDAYMITAVIHDWDDESAVRILRNIRAAGGDGGKLLVVEMVVPPGNEFGYGKFSDIEQLACFAGRERTEKEFRELFARAGFELSRIVPTAGPSSIIEGIPVAR
jgi:hypothetical protein